MIDPATVGGTVVVALTFPKDLLPPKWDGLARISIFWASMIVYQLLDKWLFS